MGIIIKTTNCKNRIEWVVEACTHGMIICVNVVDQLQRNCE